MKKILIGFVALLMLVCLVAPTSANTDAENKKELLDNLKKNLDMDSCLDIYNSVENIIMREEITVSDEQLTSILAIDYSTELSSVEYKGIVWGEYTDAEQGSALRVANQICDILGLTFKIDPTNDAQQESDISVSVYKDGKLMGIIRGDAKTDVASSPTLWYLVGGGVLVVLAILVAIIVFRKREVTV